MPIQGALAGISSGLVAGLSILGVLIFEGIRMLKDFLIEFASWFYKDPEKALISLGILWILLSPT